MLLDQLGDSKVGFLAIRERNSCSQSATNLAGNTVRECTKLRNLGFVCAGFLFDWLFFGLGFFFSKERSRMS